MEGRVVSVLELKPSERGEVSEILPGGGHRHAHRCRHCRYCQGQGRSRRGGSGRGWEERVLEDLGVCRGQVLEVWENRGRGPVILKVGDIWFVLGRGQAARILVNRLRKEVKS